MAVVGVTPNLGVVTKVSAKRDFPQRRIDRIRLLNANPSTRSAASHLVNAAADSVIRIAQEIANAEFKPRSGGRRPRKGSRHYVTSFYHEEATQDSIGRLIAKFGNRSPIAWYVEKGVWPHEITAKAGGEQSGNLVFPYNPKATRTQPGRGVTAGTRGTWPTEFFEAGSVINSSYSVNHPGSPAFRILERAREAYMDRARR